MIKDLYTSHCDRANVPARNAPNYFIFLETIIYITKQTNSFRNNFLCLRSKIYIEPFKEKDVSGKLLLVFASTVNLVVGFESD